ncbi:MAG: type 4 pilus major pilin [Alphaproteobacteria bacterium]|nr:type 4 pilus major pilin [Alphaproteobacteria bacterium]
MLEERVLPRKTRGFTLTEAAIVLGIVGLILGAIWVAAAAVYNNLRVTTTSNQLLQIVQSIRSMHATQQTVDSGINALLVAKAGGMPKDMLNNPTTPTTVTDVWAGNVLIAAATHTVANDSFAITFSGVPQGPCADLLVRNTGSGRDSGLIGAGVAVATNTAFPLGLSTAVTACSNATSNTLVFTFRLKT